MTDVEREDIDFISKTLGCLPISHVDHMRPAKLGHAALVEEVSVRLQGVGFMWARHVDSSMQRVAQRVAQRMPSSRRVLRDQI